MAAKELIIWLGISLAGVLVVILSWILLKRGRRSANASEMASETHDIILHTNARDEAEEQIAVFTLDDKPVIEVCSLPTSIQFDLLPSLPEESNVGKSFAPIIEQLPTASINASMMSGQVVLMRFAPSIQQGLSSGALTQMTGRAMAQGAGGQIAGHAMITPLGAVVAPLVVWQVLAVITAKKYLADIEKRLGGIESGINDVKRFLKYDRFGKLVGNVRHIEELSKEISVDDQRSTNAERYLKQLADVRRDCHQSMSTAEFHLSHELNELGKLKFTGAHPETVESQAKTHIATFFQECQVWYLASRIHAMCLQLECICQTNEDTIQHRIANMENWFREQQSRENDFFVEFNKKLGELSGTWQSWIYDSVRNWDSTKLERETRVKLYRSAQECRQKLSSKMSELQSLINKGEYSVVRYLIERKKPIEFAVMLDHNKKVKDVRRIGAQKSKGDAVSTNARHEEIPKAAERWPKVAKNAVVHTPDERTDYWKWITCPHCDNRFLAHKDFEFFECMHCHRTLNAKEQQGQAPIASGNVNSPSQSGVVNAKCIRPGCKARPLSGSGYCEEHG